MIEKLFASMSKAELLERLDRAGMPFAPINRPADLFDDPHLKAAGGLLPVTLVGGDNDGQQTELPALPIEMGGSKFGLRRDLPQEGEHSVEVMREAGLDDSQIEQLLAAGIVRG